MSGSIDPADHAGPEAPLTPEYEAIAQVLADYMKRANVRVIVVEPNEQPATEPAAAYTASSEPIHS